MIIDNEDFRARLHAKSPCTILEEAENAQRIINEARLHSAVVSHVYSAVASWSHIEQMPFRADVYWPLLALALLRQNDTLMRHVIDVEDTRVSRPIIFHPKEST